MQNLCNKFIAAILVTMLIGCNFITTGVYALDNIEQNIATSEDNVTFNATIGNENSHTGYEYTSDIDANDAVLYLSIGVKNSGYLNNVEITLEDNNYKIDTSKVSNEQIKSIKDNKIELNQINTGKGVELLLPIYFEKRDKISQSELSRESKAKLTATYVNQSKKEKKIEKEFVEHLTWTTNQDNLSGNISQNVIRYLNFNGKTMVSLLLSDVLNEYKLPINSKEITVAVPKLKDTLPSDAKVTAIYTANTNGKLDGVDFGKDNFQYNKENGMLTINVQNTPDENGNIAWNKDLEDKFVITYIYDINTNEEKTVINSKAASKTTLANNMIVTTVAEQTEYNLDAKMGDIATVEVESQNKTLNKGYMYSNKDKKDEKLETEYTLNYRLNVGLAEALDKITIKEVGSYFNEEDATNNVYSKKISVSKEELIKLLGEQGTINVNNAEGTLLGTLNKDTLELEVNESKLVFETSKPQTEGTLNIKLNKAIKTENDYTREKIKSFNQLVTKVQINEVAQNVIDLEEPTSKATLDISNTNLSTVVKNEDVILTATLERDDITDNLYKNPEVYIKLPEEVKEINVKDAQLLYDDELVSKSSTIEGNTIKVDLAGTQSKYANQVASNGSVIRIVTDLTLDNLAPSTTENFVLGYTNENDTQPGVREVAAAVNVIAPTGFVTTNTMSGYNGDESVTSQEGRESIAKLPTLANKEITVSGVAVNNLGQDATGFRILGRIPFKGNKQVDGSSDLGTTVDTTLSSPVSVEGINATIYYSANPTATTDLSTDHQGEENYVDNNNWVNYYMSNAKSFMIVANDAVQTESTIRFGYKVRTGYVEYTNMLKASYGIYYNNEAEVGATQNIVLATPVGIRTSEIPQMNIAISAKDTFTGNQIADGGNIKEGEYITYNWSVTNTSREDALNSKATIQLPEGVGRVIVDATAGINGMKDYSTDYTNSYQMDLGTIKAGETKTFSIDAVVYGNIIDDNAERVLRIATIADEMKDEAVQIFKANLQKGDVTGLLRVSYEDQIVEIGQEVQYYLNIKNVNRDQKNNIVAKFKLPEGLEFISTEGGKYEGNYNNSSREITFNIPNLASSVNTVCSVKAKVTGTTNSELKAKATITCNELSDTYYTNETTIYYGSPKVNAKLLSNIDGNLLDTDTLEYYIDLNNDSNVPTSIKVTDLIPSELRVASYKVENNGTVISNRENYTASSFTEFIELGAKQTVRITVVTKPHSIEMNKTKQVTNSPKVYIRAKNGEEQEVNINSLSHTIEGTSSIDSTVDPNNPSGINGIYKIIGNAWLDSNKDGKKDLNETRIANIKLTLYTQNGTVAKDSNGKELIITSDSNGRYSFDNLNRGTYIIVAEYDTNNYISTTYKAKGVIDAENADFFDARLGDKIVAATDVITIENANAYNIDLGLKEKEKFDLRLDKMVSKVTVTNTKLEPRVYEFNKNFVQVSLYNTYVEFSTVLVEYQISVTNNGKIAGYAKEIVDYIPEGMAFSSELNNNWYIGKDGNAYTTALANTIIEPGETKQVSLVLTRKMTGENVGLVHNTAEITKDYNEQGLKDGNSTPGNKQDGEDDMSSADVLLSMSTGKEVISFIGITLSVLGIVVLAVYLIKKYVIEKI